MSQLPIVLNGQKIGRFRASKILFTETFRFFWADKEMLFVPVIALIAQLFILGVAVVAVCIPAGMFVEGGENIPLSTPEYVALFAFYVMSAFVLAFSQAVITHIVYTRIHGGDATLGDGMKVAASHTSALLVWACITSTVGIILRTIAERSQLLVKILVAVMGAMWSVLTYFVVPAIVIDKKSAFAAIGHSGSVFKRTWGETLIANFSLGLMFFVFFLVIIFAFIGFAVIVKVSPVMVLIGGGIVILAIIFASLLSAVLESVLRTLLYVYASEHIVPQNFNQELLESMLGRKPVTSSIPTPVQGV